MLYKNEDILKNLTHEETVIMHGCNCFHTMGSGIAKYLRSRYPAIYTADISQTIKRDVGKLGSYSVARITPTLHILNLYTQYGYGCKNGIDANYDAIEKCLQKFCKQYGYSWNVRAPKIGCGLAGGDWDVVRPLFEKYLNHYDVTIYSLK